MTTVELARTQINDAMTSPLSINKADYGYNNDIETIRQNEYPSLANELYLDHAGATLFAKSLIHRSSEALIEHAYGNPHSKSPASERSTEMVELTRLKVLKLFNADPGEYSVVFTANATAAVKLVGEGGLSMDNYKYVYLNDSHTSLVGLRGLASEYRMVTEDQMVEEITNRDPNSKLKLISWPGQSNFSGQRYPSKFWSKKASFRSGVYTLVDAAAEASSHPIDLSTHGPDFVAVSFYKIFGYPDLGALLVKKTSGQEYFKNRRYFGGGTVESLAAGQSFAPRHANISSKLEDGTVPFHSILQLSCAIDVHYDLYGSFANISSHTATVANQLYERLKSLKHSTGIPLCHVYSHGNYHDPTKQGPIVTFNLVNENNGWIGYAEVAQLASEAGINIRTGTLCNSGANSQWVGITEQDIMDNHAKGHVCGDDNDVMNGVPTGAIRASFGACSSIRDADRLVEFLQEYYIDQHTTLGKDHASTALQHVASVTLFPIKSCGGFSIPNGVSWPISKQGLLWDREFCLVNLANESVMSLKKYPKMAMVSPVLDVDQNTLTVYFQGNSVQLSLSLNYNTTASKASHCIQTVMCGDKVPIQLYKDPKIVEFFSNALGIDCTLARFPHEEQPSMRFYKPHLNGPLTTSAEPAATETSIPITMSNSSPLLLISEQSVDQLAKDNGYAEIDSSVFRANIKIAGNSLPPFAEDNWHRVEIRNQPFTILGPCRRCNMVGVDAKTGKHNSQPYLALHKTRKLQGQLLFGQHMAIANDHAFIAVGDPVKTFQ